ncbi:uncharacterized protein JCM15063_006042 [Sporobolomyces koalae]|uniref:uncharacterized protein n=1 Tax=Sporobolomyces koalae TaxID=500713 RepID=UPI0031778BC0
MSKHNEFNQHTSPSSSSISPPLPKRQRFLLAPNLDPVNRFKLASTHPPAAGAAGGGGFKLKLTLGGQSAAPPAPTATQPAPTYAAPTYPAQQGSWSTHPEPVPARSAHVASAQYAQARDADDDAGDSGRVSGDKYRKLKKKYLAAIEARDEASLSLFRAQKLIHRLREDKSALLDRVLELEVAAGITSADVLATHEADLRTERERAFPLLNPPDLPSMEDRARPLPVLTTSTDFSNSTYNDPVGPAPLPKSFPPRQRSLHLQSAIAAQRLRDDYDAKLAAQGLERAAFPTVAALGLQGSSIALTVERALAGETLEPVEHAQAARGNKRRRESSSGRAGSGAGSGAKSRANAAAINNIVVPQEPSTLQYLPNPFATAGAIPEGATMARNSTEALAAAQAAAAVEMQQQQQQEVHASPYEIPVAATPALDYDMDDGTSQATGAGGAYSDDEEDFKPNLAGAGGKRGGRQSAGPDKPSRPKKSKGSALNPGVHTIPIVQRNPDGTPRLPLAAGIMTLTNLGVVTDQEGFHSDRYIYPIGYEATRRYPSIVNKTADVEYTCRIVDSGQGGPRFELHPSDQPGTIIHAATATGAWAQIVKAANKLRERNHSNSVSGPDYYGLSHNLVKALIQELPGANALPGYIMQTFVEDPTQSSSLRGKRGKKPRRKSKAGGAESEAEDLPTYGIEVDDSTYDTSGYGNGTYTREGSYDSASYPASASPEDTTGYAVPDYSNPASLANLLQGAGAQPAPADPYSLPGFGAAPAAAPYDPYAIPPAQPAFGGMDPYNASGSFGAYDLPGGQQYASSDASSP